MRARYFVRVRLPSHWSTIVVIGPGNGSRAVALRFRELLLGEPGWEWPVRVDPTSKLGPLNLKTDAKKKLERAILQSEVEWDVGYVADLLARAREGRRPDRIGTMPKKPRGAKKRYNAPPSLDRKKPHV